MLDSNSTINVKTVKFIALLPMLTQEAVTLYITREKEAYPMLREIIVMI
jgi:hypothetical protein